MRRNHKGIFAIIIVLTGLLTFSCSKKSEENKPVEDKNSVTINGTVYPTVTIGSQVWTTVNYKGTGGYNVSATAAYGSYYTRSQAIAVGLPTGWRVPSTADYNKLFSNFTKFQDADGFFNVLGGAAPLCSTSGWSVTQGTNTSGFNVLPGGYYVVSPAQAQYTPDQNAFFVTSDFRAVTSTVHAIYGVQISPDFAVIIRRPDPEGISFSLRFIKDM